MVAFYLYYCVNDRYDVLLFSLVNASESSRLYEVMIPLSCICLVHAFVGLTFAFSGCFECVCGCNMNVNIDDFSNSNTFCFKFYEFKVILVNIDTFAIYQYQNMCLDQNVLTFGRTNRFHFKG
jgi:hypothetical protein